MNPEKVILGLPAHPWLSLSQGMLTADPQSQAGEPGRTRTASLGQGSEQEEQEVEEEEEGEEEE